MEEKKKYCQSCKHQSNKPSTCKIWKESPIPVPRKATCHDWSPKK